MEKEYLLFNANGSCFNIVDPDLFFSSISEEELQTFYMCNYYYYLMESANKVLKEVKYKCDIPLMEAEDYQKLKNTIELFRMKMTGKDIEELETITLLSFSFSNLEHFSNN